eukprot:6657074-Prymnesium_polylepis.2
MRHQRKLIDTANGVPLVSHGLRMVMFAAYSESYLITMCFFLVLRAYLKACTIALISAVLFVEASGVPGGLGWLVTTGPNPHSVSSPSVTSTQPYLPFPVFPVFPPRAICVYSAAGSLAHIAQLLHDLPR